MTSTVTETDGTALSGPEPEDRRATAPAVCADAGGPRGAYGLMWVGRRAGRGSAGTNVKRDCCGGNTSRQCVDLHPDSPRVTTL